MIKLGGLIGLKPLNEEEVFTATNKETGNVSVFKSKASRDAAVKSGSHEMRKDDKEDGVEKPSPKVNIFNKDKEEPKSDTPNSKTSDFSQEEKKELEALLDTSDDGNPNFSQKTIDDIIETHKDRLSPEQIKDLKQAGEEAGENLSRLIGDDWYPFEKYEKIKNDVGNRVKKILGLDGDKKEEPKSEPQSTTSKTLSYTDDAYDEIEQIGSFDELQDYAQSKEGLSDEQRKQLQDLADEWEDAEGEMMVSGDDDEYEEATSSITARAMEVVFGPEESWGEPNESTSMRRKDLLPEVETFTATNKKSGKTVVFKSKDARDAAVKSGSHEMRKDDNDGDTKNDKGGVNIFKKDKEQPKQDGPVKDSSGGRAGNPQVNKATKKKAEELGITPSELGREEYEKTMIQAAVAALTDSNYHSEARELIAMIEDKPEWKEDPRKSAPSFDSPEYDEWRKNSVYSSEYYDADSATEELGQTASQEAGWNGVDALDGIAFELKTRGFVELAKKIQSVIKENTSTRLKDLV